MAILILSVRVLLPGAITTAILLRPFGLSILYLLLFFLLPLVNVPDKKTFHGFRGVFLLVPTVLSSIILLVHVAWHATLAYFSPYGSLLDRHPLLEIIGVNLGLVAFTDVPITMMLQYLAPDIIVLVSSGLIYMIVKKVTRSRRADHDQSVISFQQWPVLTSVCKYVCLLLLLLSSAALPSITSGIYFLVFILVATACSLAGDLGRLFSVIGQLVMLIMAVHLIVLFVYQLTWLQDWYEPHQPFARYFGLRMLVRLNAEDNNGFQYEPTYDSKWATVANPLFLLITYFCFAIECQELLKPKKTKTFLENLESGFHNGHLARGISFNLNDNPVTRKWKGAAKKVRVAYSYIDTKALRGDTSEYSPLMDRKISFRQKDSVLRQDSAGSVVVENDTPRRSTTENTISVMIELGQLIVRSSYIPTTIVMMAWSIMYHSWLTFVFLMWANVVWLCSNQRSIMLKSSPILVLYASLLIIVQYVYAMDLTESELPSEIPYMNLRQLGVSRPDGIPGMTLVMKSLFTCFFWLTLHQYAMERRQKTLTSISTDLAAPVHVTVSTAASGLEAQQESRLLNQLGKSIRAFCARYWIYVVVIMLFVIGISGKRMTMFRIIYMFLFLSFILMFQISWRWWRRSIYIFWITVIIYSMINLIMIYIYQFDNFANLIAKYLYIDKRLQNDLGLEPYDPADLFVKLLTPTLFLIITILQVHYFHKDFMALSDPTSSRRITSTADSASTTAAPHASSLKDVPPLPLEDKASHADDSTSVGLSSLKGSKNEMASKRRRSTDSQSLKYKNWIVKNFQTYRAVLKSWIDKMFIFLDLHLIKITLFSLMLLCVIEVSAIHIPIMFLIAPALLFHKGKQRIIVLFISILISVYFMAKMVYQIDYISHQAFVVECTDSTKDGNNTVLYNNAVWLGFAKSTQGGLVKIEQGYIGIMCLITFYSIVRYRQQTIRQKGLLHEDTNKMMFPHVNREDADKNLKECIKFLFNYGFYKFGVEITLISLIATIAARMDVYASIYSLWLGWLVSLNRESLAKQWRCFTVFIMVLVPIQYLLAVGLVPQLCIEYPWAGSSNRIKQLRKWLYLPDYRNPPYASKLIFDYLLLMFASRQLRVFVLERKYKDSYGGGSNDQVESTTWETAEFVNPVPDFLGTMVTWLDFVKRVVFMSMLWVTLAIMFLTGTNRVNLFSIGYLIGSFIFLWQGTDFYLLPKSYIMRWWSWLLSYNVSVVVLKTLLQIPGCIFSVEMQKNACWLVQLLGIGCVDKFAGGNISQFLKMTYIKDSVCSVPQEDIGLAWDGVCFAFLLLQRRLFHSYYFYRIIDESKATTILASRGAELIEELRQKQMELQEDQEQKILEKIKAKMERIKANQKKIKGALAKEPLHHDADDDSHMESSAAEGGAGGRGFHTPESAATPRDYHTPLSDRSPDSSRAASPDVVSLAPAPPAPPPPPATIPLPPGGPPSPSSALMTASLSLDAYLEPRRISFSSPPSSEVAGRAQSPEESYPVFSPPPIRRRTSFAPSALARASVATSVVSQWSHFEPKSHQSSAGQWSILQPRSHQQATHSGDYYMFDDEFDDTEVQIEQTEKELERDEEIPREMGIGSLLANAFKTDLRQAISKRKLSTSEDTAGQEHPSLPKPKSVLKHEGTSEALDADVHTAEPELIGKIHRIRETVWIFIASILISMTGYLMKFSRDYRYVSNTLSVEKRAIKERPCFGIGVRGGPQMRWEPLPKAYRKLSEISVPEIRILAPSMERGLDDSPAPRPRPESPSLQLPSGEDEDATSEHESAFSLQPTESQDVTMLQDHEDSVFKRQKNPAVHLSYALWYAVLAHTDVVCYIMVFINQIQSATILSIPLPLMVFLWGTLSIPRPTKTFWVTMIAYTEVIVLVKSMFQFEMLPWNQKAIPSNTPFSAPRVIGIERKPSFAIYDLLLLLFIFFHRYMLKSLGLWKESVPEMELRADAKYPLTYEDTQMLVDGEVEKVGRKYIKIHDSSGPHHPMIDRLYFVRAAMEQVAQELNVRWSDPRVAIIVHEKLSGSRASQYIEKLKRQEEEKEAALKLSRGSKSWTTSQRRSYFSHKEKASEGEQTQGSTGRGSVAAPQDSHISITEVYENTNVLKEGRIPSEESEKPEDDSDDDPVIVVTSTLEDIYENYPGVIILSIKRYFRPMVQFFRRMLQPGSRVKVDIYAYMFMCDFINFLVVIFGFAAFGTHQGDGGVQAYLEENKVPIPFLVMLILQFALIIIDRALYLRKYMLGKILFQYALIIGVHIWMFFVLPFITERTFNTMPAPPTWYMVKCVYLLLSAYQIRSGYPRRIIGNFLCKSYSYINQILFRGFMAVPFVFELRTLMDWIWTDTSMNLMDWLKMEDIFASVYLLKCSRYIENEFPQPRGEKKTNLSKYALGGGVLAFVISIIWFPLVFFAFGNTVGQPNPPTDITVKIRIGPFLPVYMMSAQSHNIALYTENDYNQLLSLYSRDRTAQTFLSNYMFNDVAVVTFNPYSTLKWEISPPEHERLQAEVKSKEPLLVKFTFVISHKTNAQNNPPVFEESRIVELPSETINGSLNIEREKLYEMLNGTAGPDTWLEVPTLFPKFVKIFNKGLAKPAYQLIPGPDDVTDSPRRNYRGVLLRLERSKDSMYWHVRESCEQRDFLNSIPMNDCNMLVMYTFNDKLFPDTLNFISGSGIIGLYTTFVFLASRVIRGFFSGIYTRIMFDDLPNVDRVLQLCLDIYLVREAVELTLEEDLFAKLVFLYRSPETMIKWTRPKEEPTQPQAIPPPP